MADGSITLTVTPDISKVKDLDKALSTALKNGDTKLAGLIQNFQKANNAVEQQTVKVQELRQQLDGLKSGDVAVENASIKSMQADFEKARAEIRETENELARLKSLPYADNEQISALTQKLEDSKGRADALANSLDKAVGVATQQEIGKTTAQLNNAETKLEQLTTQADIAGTKLQQSGTKMADVTEGISKGFEKVTNRIGGLIKRVFFFSVITLGLRKLRKVFSDVAMSDEGFRQSLYRLQAALWTAFTPIVSYIIPVVQRLINILTAAATAIGRFIAFLTGKSYADMANSAKALQNQADAYKNIGKNSGSAAKGMKKATDEAKKQLAAFDDLMIISEDKADADSGAGGGGGAGGISGMQLGEFESPIDKISTTLQALMGIAGAALVGLGLWLLFHGQIAWGIGCIIAGLTVFGVSMATLGGMPKTQQVENALNYLMGVASGALVALGLILLMFGHPAWGIGAIIAGITLFGVSEKGLGTFNTNDVKSVLTTLMGFAGGAMVALGLMLLVFTGPTPLALGTLAFGIAQLSIGLLQLREGETSGKTQQFLHTIVQYASEALLALGILLLLTGLNPLGFGLLLVGAVGLATEAMVNNKTETYLGTKLKEWTLMISGALLVLGLMLLFAGIIPLGFGLLAAGAVGLATAADVNWDFIGNKIKEVWENIQTYWKTHIAKYFTKEWWANLGKTALNGLIDMFEKGINKLLKGVFSFVQKAASAIQKVGDVLGFNINIPQVPQISIRRLAQGAVLPPNKPFLAMVGDQKSGTNIEAPLQTIVEAMNIALQGQQQTYGNTEVVLEIDGREFGRAVVEQGNRESRRIGTRLVLV